MNTIETSFDDEKQAEVPAPRPHNPSGSPLSIVKTLIGECFCGPIAPADPNGLTTQFIELHGIEFIGLGAVTDELTPKERVYDTLEQLTERTERLVSIGYLVDDDKVPGRKITESIPLDIWNKTFPNDRTMSRSLRRTITSIKARTLYIEMLAHFSFRNYSLNKTGFYFLQGRDFESAIQDFKKEFEYQERRPMINNNMLLRGITAHNIGVVYILAGRDKDAIPYFRQAVELKKSAFGKDHPEVAVSLDELGIQLFAIERFAEALAAFNESRKIMSKWYGATHSTRLCMLLNNIACCTFQMGDIVEASLIMQEARDLQRERNENSGAKVDLDLLHLAILANNFGYLKAQQKQYDVARSCFEEAMLVSSCVCTVQKC
jgi:tetratricopeptide (TPR) repeat protein